MGTELLASYSILPVVHLSDSSLTYHQTSHQTKKITTTTTTLGKQC